MTLSRLRRPTLCLTCEDEIARGDLAHVERGVGAWHADCAPPLNLHIYQRERDRGQRRSRHSDLDDFRS